MSLRFEERVSILAGDLITTDNLMSSVRLENVSKTYDGRKAAVRDVSLFINDKEFVVLVGPSGCGKSTTLRLIAGLEQLSDGKIYFDDQPVNEVAPKDRDVAMVFQNYALYPHMSVFENLAFGLKMRNYKKPDIEQLVHQTAEILDIKDFLDRKPKALSGGQRQRVALGRAIVRRPRVFLFDEPLSNLDANLRVQMRTELSRLHRRLEMTMIYVTHDQIEAMSMGDRIVVMKDGVVHQVDTPLSIYNNPANQFVAGFIGSPAINFLTGKISNDNGYHFEHSLSGMSIRIPPLLQHRVAVKNQEIIILGIRPEHILARPVNEFSQKVSVDVDVTEPVGNEIFVYFSLGTQSQMSSRIPADIQPVRGKSFELYIDASKLHFFDKNTGKAL